MQKPAAIRNTTWAELQVGASASLERSCLVQDLYLFAHVSGNTNPLMLPGRADNDRARLASCALALLYDVWRREGRPFKGRPDAALVAA